MTTGSILLALALLILVVLFVARPFLLPPSAPVRLSERPVFLAQKEVLLAQIRALDFDAETGKLEPADYEAEREQLFAHATAVLQQLDETADVEAEIEAAVKRLRQKNSDLGDLNFCPQCGNSVSDEDKFCAHCGHQLRGAAA